MKNVYSLILILSVIGLAFSSCKKEDKKEEVVAAISLVANWKTATVNRELFFKNNTTGIKYPLAISDYVDHIKFNADGTGNMSVSGVVIRKFTYTFTNADIHFANVFSYNGKDWIHTDSFMFFINSFTGQEIVFTQNDYNYNHVVQNGKEYDQIVTNVKIVKEN
ncbi:hypothetical protein NAF17_11480 [Mucilaginibacter sp. RB4R14]|uniref:hypothetical protein n=1 Tax=Mucilaginibacter aurantiaciroseus TaxID=2949308 RepID=UPI002091743B|nr:hypothetical protein [Mucilaginibacter aurantiaciroseus]MCO5936158.1 hypothetical protein [Mucilaginibacter aurantiaciroseus]